MRPKLTVFPQKAACGAAQVSGLLQHLTTQTRYQAFLRALEETGQHHVVTNILKEPHTQVCRKLN